MFHEADRIRDRLAVIKNDIGAIDRTLTVLGYTGDLDAAMSRHRREVLFGRGELPDQSKHAKRVPLKPVIVESS